ncbi:unnamed protein product [Closterium sp. Naga37s-1]|nr:unnamed protein product [Closterium sp. Naga37s-1]
MKQDPLKPPSSAAPNRPPLPHTTGGAAIAAAVRATAARERRGQVAAAHARAGCCGLRAGPFSLSLRAPSLTPPQAVTANPSNARLWMEAASANPDSAELWMEVGVEREALGQHERAHEAFSCALLLQPGNAEALKRRGLSAFNLYRFKDSLKDLLPALHMLPNDADLNQAVGIALVRSNQFRAAQPYLARAVELLPLDADLRKEKGRLHRLLGETDHAERDLLLSLQLGQYDTRAASQPGAAEATAGRSLVSIHHPPSTTHLPPPTTHHRPATPPPLHPSTSPPLHPSTSPPLHPSTPPPLHPFTPPLLHPSTPPPLHLSTTPPLHPSTPPPLHPIISSQIPRSVCFPSLSLASPTPCLVSSSLAHLSGVMGVVPMADAGLKAFPGDLEVMHAKASSLHMLGEHAAAMRLYDELLSSPVQPGEQTSYRDRTFFQRHLLAYTVSRLDQPFSAFRIDDDLDEEWRVGVGGPSFNATCWLAYTVSRLAQPFSALRIDDDLDGEWRASGAGREGEGETWVGEGDLNNDLDEEWRLNSPNYPHSSLLFPSPPHLSPSPSPLTPPLVHLPLTHPFFSPHGRQDKWATGGRPEELPGFVPLAIPVHQLQAATWQRLPRLSGAAVQLVEAADVIGARTHYDTDGMLHNTQQLRMAGLAALDVMQQVRRTLLLIADQMRIAPLLFGADAGDGDGGAGAADGASGGRELWREQLEEAQQQRLGGQRTGRSRQSSSSGGGGSSVAEGTEESSTDSSSSGSSSSSSSRGGGQSLLDRSDLMTSWRHMFRVLVAWRQVSDATETVAWKAFAQGQAWPEDMLYCTGTPIFTWVMGTARYLAAYPNPLPFLPDLFLSSQPSFFPPSPLPFLPALFLSSQPSSFPPSPLPFLPALFLSSQPSSFPPSPLPFLPALFLSSQPSSFPPSPLPFLPALFLSSQPSSFPPSPLPFLPALFLSSLPSSFPPSPLPVLPALFLSSLPSSFPPSPLPVLPALFLSSLPSSFPPSPLPFLPALFLSSMPFLPCPSFSPSIPITGRAVNVTRSGLLQAERAFDADSHQPLDVPRSTFGAQLHAPVLFWLLILIHGPFPPTLPCRKDLGGTEFKLQKRPLARDSDMFTTVDSAWWNAFDSEVTAAWQGVMEAALDHVFPLSLLPIPPHPPPINTPPSTQPPGSGL